MEGSLDAYLSHLRQMAALARETAAATASVVRHAMLTARPDASLAAAELRAVFDDLGWRAREMTDEIEELDDEIRSLEIVLSMSAFLDPEQAALSAACADRTLLRLQ